VVTRWRDVGGVEREVAPETVAAILDGLEADAVRPRRRHPMRVRAGRRRRLHTPAEVLLEDGTRLKAAAVLPADLPAGWHHLEPPGGGQGRPLIVDPGPCHLPAGLRAWGLAVQLPALRSAASWGIGDLADLRDLGRWAAGELGAGALLVSPLHAAGPVPPQQASPYYPSSRRFRNPLALRIDEVTGAESAGLELDALARRARRLNRRSLLDRDAVLTLKMAALEHLWGNFAGDAEFDAWRRRQGPALEAWAVHCALTEAHGAGWPAWPAALRHPAGAAVARFAAARAERVAFHAWVQWLLERQLSAAAAAVPLLADVALGIDPRGCDAWVDQDLLVAGVRVGAPPDAFATAGQDWGIPAFHPGKLSEVAHRPVVDVLRTAFAHSAGLRLDHVMGLFRLWWIPQGREPHEGAYVRYPADELLATLAIESRRASALVVGEDLGTVASAIRTALAQRAVLSTRLLCFEDGAAADLPSRCLAAVTTHDLPTVAGLWSGADLEARRRLGLEADGEGGLRLRLRLRRHAGVAEGAAVAEVATALHSALAASPAMLVMATLEDMLGVEQRPNMPGTRDTWPNWRLALPVTLERLRAHPLALRVAAAIGARGPAAQSTVAGASPPGRGAHRRAQGRGGR